jgi:hypothetical protein
VFKYVEKDAPSDGKKRQARRPDLRLYVSIVLTLYYILILLILGYANNVSLSNEG